MLMRLLPRLATELRMASPAPRPTASMAITAATPITMPRIVRKVRILLRASERSARRRRAETGMSGGLGTGEGFGERLQRRARRGGGGHGFVHGDAPVAYHDPALGEGGDVGFVRHQHDGDAPRVQVLE